MLWRAPLRRLPWRPVLDGVAFYTLWALDGLVCVSIPLLVSANGCLNGKAKTGVFFSGADL